MNYNIVILGGGQATRMGDLCKDIPKSLFKINGKSLLQRQLEWVAPLKPLQVVVAGSYMADRMAPVCAVWGCDLNTDEGAGGTGWAIYRAMQRLNKKEYPTVVMNGDVLTDMPVTDLVATYRSVNEEFATGIDSYYVLASRLVQDTSSFGSINTENIKGFSHIKSFNEKTGIKGPGLINAGMYVFDTEGFIRDCAGLTHFWDNNIKLSIEKDLFPEFDWMYTHTIPEKYNWSDCGTPERVLEASRWLR